MTAEPLVFGQWVAETVLGRGAMGVVYRAKHRETGQLAALKALRTVSPARAASLRREVAVLAELDHPAIVSVIDSGGDEAGTPWYAMELIEGRSLRLLLNGDVQPTASNPWWTVSLAPTMSVDAMTLTPDPDEPETLPQSADESNGASTTRLTTRTFEATLVGHLHQICGALACLHAEGLVHRDVKPDNIVVRDDGSAVLVDFGLALQSRGGSGREAVELESDVAGTVLYMAPEQIRGDRVDARADLYSLGCVLFEVICGRPPFGPAPLVDLANMHMSAAAPDVPALCGGVPERLVELVGRLLEKQPSHRLGYAEDVARVMQEVLNLPPLRLPKLQSYLYRPDVVARDDVIEHLVSRCHHRSEPGGSVVVILGESGVGKTTCVREALRVARLGGREVALATCDDGSKTPLGAFRPVPAALGAPRAATDPLPAESFLEELSHVADAAGDDPVFDAVRLIEEGTSSRPIVWVIDDLQWADPLSLSVFARLVSMAGSSTGRWLVLATCRSHDLSGRVRSAVEPNLRGFPTVVSLGRFAPGDVASMAASMLGSEPDEGFVDFLTARSEGNPYFVAEYLRAAVQREIFARRNGEWLLGDGERSWSSIELPTGLRELLVGRREALPPKARSLAELVAVFGRQAATDALSALAGDLRGASRCLREQILVEDDEAFRFTHAHLRDVFYEGIEPPERLRLHAAVADWLAQRLAANNQGGAEQGALALSQADIGRHRALAGETDKALAAFAAAISASGANVTLRTAMLESWLEQAGHEPKGEVLARRLELVEAKANTGHAAAALELAAVCQQQAAELGDWRRQVEALLLGSRCAEYLRDREPAEECLERVAQITRTHELPGRLEARFLLRKVKAARAWQTTDDVLPVVNEAIDRCRELGVDDIAAKLLVQQGLALRMARLDDRELATFWRQAIEANRAVGNDHDELIARNNLHHCLRDEEAVVLARELLQDARRLGYRSIQAHALRTLSHIELDQLRPRSALPLINESLDLARLTGSNESLLGAGLVLSWAWLDLGDFAKARHFAHMTIDHNGAAEQTYPVGVAYLQLGRIAACEARIAHRAEDRATVIERLAAATAHFNEARAVFDHLRFSIMIQMVERDLASLHADLAPHPGSFSLAAEGYRRALDLVDDEEERILNLVGLADLHRRRGDPSQALARIIEAEPLLGNTTRPLPHLTWLLQRIALAEQSGQSTTVWRTKARQLWNRGECSGNSPLGLAYGQVFGDRD